jgi:hypothetical protein
LDMTSYYDIYEFCLYIWLFKGAVSSSDCTTSNSRTVYAYLITKDVKEGDGIFINYWRD